MATAKPSQPARPATREGLMVWIIHRFAEEFDRHAILKGGMALRLLDSERQTNDLDFVFVPFASKKEISPGIARVLQEIEGASVKVELHSKMIRCEVRLDDAAVQVEASVEASCESIPVATSSLASAYGQPSRVVRIMEPGVALAHKLAAWNERRLLRDLYDAYFLLTRARAVVNLDVLRRRLAKIESRLPALRKRSRMSIPDFAAQLDHALGEMTDKSVQESLAGLVEASELSGLALRIRVSLQAIVHLLLAAPEG